MLIASGPLSFCSRPSRVRPFFFFFLFLSHHAKKKKNKKEKPSVWDKYSNLKGAILPKKKKRGPDGAPFLCLQGLGRGCLWSVVSAVLTAHGGKTMTGFSGVCRRGT
jgi:hypothetical protein